MLVHHVISVKLKIVGVSLGLHSLCFRKAASCAGVGCIVGVLAGGNGKLHPLAKAMFENLYLSFLGVITAFTAACLSSCLGTACLNSYFPLAKAMSERLEFSFLGIFAVFTFACLSSCLGTACRKSFFPLC